MRIKIKIKYNLCLTPGAIDLLWLKEVRLDGGYYYNIHLREISNLK